MLRNQIISAYFVLFYLYIHQNIQLDQQQCYNFYYLLYFWNILTLFTKMLPIEIMIYSVSLKTLFCQSTLVLALFLSSLSFSNSLGLFCLLAMSLVQSVLAVCYSFVTFS